MAITAFNMRNVANNGGKWIRPEKRLAIYLRDKYTCSWCNEKLVENNATLDHVKPQTKGIDNSSKNLITACRRCNSARGNRSVSEFAEVVAKYVDHGETKHSILKRIRRRRRRKLSIAWAKSLIYLNKSLTEIINNGQNAYRIHKKTT